MNFINEFDMKVFWIVLSDKLVICEIPRVGDKVSFDSIPGEYRVSRVARKYGGSNGVDIDVFVIRISESAERLPNED